jgi:hypothetical protein
VFDVFDTIPPIPPVITTSPSSPIKVPPTSCGGYWSIADVRNVMLIRFFWFLTVKIPEIT